jgi:23S rRNA (adenine2503-C2)-methyltransferase
MIEICGLTVQDLKAWFSQEGLEAFRADQVFDWIYHKGALSFDAMTNLKKELRDKLKASFAFPCN